MSRLQLSRKTFYDETNKRVDILDDRFYFEDENPEVFFPSVTHILDSYPKGFALTMWHKSLGFNADIVLEKARKKGVKIHDAIHNYLNGVTLTFGASNNNEFISFYSIDEWNQLLRFHDFWSTVNPELIISECIIISPLYKMGGTIDIICVINGERWLVDVKTGDDIYPSYEFQLAAYCMMWNEKNPDLHIDRTGILHLDAATRGSRKNKIQGEGWNLYEFQRHYGDAFKIFKALRVIWDEQNPEWKPKNKSIPAEIFMNSNIANHE